MNITVCLKHGIRVLILAALGLTPAVASVTFVTDPGAGNGSERCLTSGAGNGGNCAAEGAYSGLESMIQLFADSEGLTLSRVDDSSDQTWTASANSGVFGIARSAGRDFTLGVIPGDSGDTEDYEQVLGVIGSAAAPTEYLPTIPAGQNANGDLQTSATYSSGLPVFTGLPTQIQNGSDFRFAIQQSTATNPDLWSSNPADNRDAHDHMVTWQLTGGNVPAGDVWYIVGFENAVFPGSDGDFNDYVFLFQNVSPNAAVPEPNSAISGTVIGALLVLGGLGRISKRG
jgi:hypothetical protein